MNWPWKPCKECGLPMINPNSSTCKQCRDELSRMSATEVYVYEKMKRPPKTQKPQA